MKPKQFDVNDALRNAMYLFWEHGFDGTSMQMLQEHLGLSRASIYHTFESKNVLFRQALNHYFSACKSNYESFLNSIDNPFEAIFTLFQRTYQSKRPYPLGCLLVLSTLEVSQHEPETQTVIQSSHQLMHHLFSSKLEKAGILNHSEKADVLCVLFNGFAVINKTGKPITDYMIDNALHFLRSSD